MKDPLAESPWSSPGTVAGFARSAPNDVLLRLADSEWRRINGSSPDSVRGRAIDIGCGAARNAVPLALAGWDVTGTDLSWPMLVAAAERSRQAGVTDRVHLILAGMDQIPAADDTFDLVIAHGIWNLASSGAEFRGAVAEAARVAKPGAALFVFTFSRNTFPPDTAPVAGESFVFTEFSGRPQCFLTYEQLVAEMGSVGFAPDPTTVPVTEYNRPQPGALRGGGPVIYEAAFRLPL